VVKIAVLTHLKATKNLKISCDKNCNQDKNGNERSSDQNLNPRPLIPQKESPSHGLAGAEGWGID
jgi:hypothetical protein